jgi:hypothetical protein
MSDKADVLRGRLAVISDHERDVPDVTNPTLRFACGDR